MVQTKSHRAYLMVQGQACAGMGSCGRAMYYVTGCKVAPSIVDGATKSAALDEEDLVGSVTRVVHDVAAHACPLPHVVHHAPCSFLAAAARGRQVVQAGQRPSLCLQYLHPASYCNFMQGSLCRMNKLHEWWLTTPPQHNSRDPYRSTHAQSSCQACDRCGCQFC